MPKKESFSPVDISSETQRRIEALRAESRATGAAEQARPIADDTKRRIEALRAEVGREAAARSRAIEATEQAATTERPGREVVFSLDPPRGPAGRETVVKIRTASGEGRDILDVVPGARRAGVRIVFGEEVGVDLSSFGKEAEKRRVIIPTVLKAEDLPFLVREIIRAARYDEKREIYTYKKKKKKGKGGEEEGEEEPITVTSQTVEGQLIKAELDARKKLEEGWAEIQRDFRNKVPFHQIFEKYKKLETKHSQAWRPAEHIINELMSEAEADWARTFGTNLFEAYGGVSGFRQELRQRAKEAQACLVFQADEKSGRLYLTGETKDLFWTLTTGISRTAAKQRLLCKLRGEKVSDSPWPRGGIVSAKMAGAGLLLLLELGLLIPRKAANAVLETADDWLYNLQSKFGSWAYGKKYKPRLKKMAERREEEEKEFERLVKKARGKQE